MTENKNIEQENTKLTRKEKARLKQVGDLSDMILRLADRKDGAVVYGALLGAFGATLNADRNDDRPIDACTGAIDRLVEWKASLQQVAKKESA